MSFQFEDTKLFHFNDDEHSDSADTLDEPQSRRSRTAVSGKPSGACVDCKSVKVRCEFAPGEQKCRRCQAKNLPCRPRERKKRKAADTHEQLLERSHAQDLRIRNLLLQYEQLRTEQKIHQWMTRAPPSVDVTTQRPIKWAQKGKTPEQAVISYFSTASDGRSLSPPGIVKHCSLYPEDITELFSIYFARVDPYFSILDKDYHTAQRLLWTSPFLFTVVCAVASRYYTARRNLYQVAMEFARDFAGKALIEGHRSIDVCQAYLIMAVYPVPKKKWVEDRSWLLMGVAIRMAIELELNQPPPPGCDEREALNRMRTWLNCYCVDGSHAIQFGKMPMLRLDDYNARNSADWYRSSPLNTPFDVHLCAYVQLLLHMAKWRAYIELPKTGAEPREIISAAMEMHSTIESEMDKWAGHYVAELTLMPLPICSYRANTTQMISAYLRLVVLLAAFQCTNPENLRQESEVFIKALNAARSVIQFATERLYPTGYLRYAMEAQFLYMAFAAAFLLNLFRPRYVGLLDLEIKREIVSLVSRLISVLGSPDVALDGRHTPALYSRFLSSLMSKHNLSIDQLSFDLENDPSGRNIAQEPRNTTPSNAYYWPDVSNSENNNSDPLAAPGAFGYQFSANQMDFSLSHFIKTVAEVVPHAEKIEPTPDWIGADMMWNPQPMPWDQPNVMPILAGWRG